MAIVDGLVVAAAWVAAYHVAEIDREMLVTTNRSNIDSCWRTLSPLRSRLSSGTGADAAAAAADVGVTGRDGGQGCAADGVAFVFGAWSAVVDGEIVTSLDDWQWYPWRSPDWRLDCRHLGRVAGSVDLKVGTIN